METVVTLGMMVALALAALFILERALGYVFQWFASILPDDMAGPDGWLVDTQNGKGIFDRQCPR